MVTATLPLYQPTLPLPAAPLLREITDPGSARPQALPAPGQIRGRDLTARLETEGPIVPELSAAALREARQVWSDLRQRFGFSGMAKLLTPPSANYKLAKGEGSYGLTLAPADAAQTWIDDHDPSLPTGPIGTVCRYSTPACRASCVISTAGKGPVPSVQRARAARTAFLAGFPGAFVSLMFDELLSTVRREGGVLFRPNTASDLRWEYIAPSLFGIAGARFYDYTKVPIEERGSVEGYRLVFSVSEREESLERGRRYVEAGGTSAVVLRVKKREPLPSVWQGLPMIDGDEDDDRTADPEGVWVGLRAKGAGIRDTTGFVREA
jgi:hypothetical protein